MSYRHIALTLSFMASLGGCAYGDTYKTAQPVSHTPQRSGVYVAGATDREIVEMDRWIGEVRAIFASKELAQTLQLLDADYDRVQLSSGKFVNEPSDLVAILRGNSSAYPSTSFVPVALALSGTGIPDATWDSGYGNNEDHTAIVDWTGDTNEPHRVMRLGRVHFHRFIHGNQVERSCAVNTMAHEMIHSLTDAPGPPFRYLFTDNDPPTTGPVATYLLGAAAQCTYLRKAGRITTDAQVRTCVATFGTRNPFLRNRCNDYSDTAAFP